MPTLQTEEIMQGNSNMVMEIVRFGTLPGTSPADLAKAAQEGRDWLAHQPGFVARALCQQGTGFVDMVTWADMASAQAAAAQVMTEPAFAGFMALIDGPTVRMEHLPILVAPILVAKP
jgi:hypothetical protein